MQNTWSKLKSGGWGVRCKAEDPFEELPAPGATVIVEKRNGETSEVTLGSQVWSGKDDGSPIGLYALD
jgi:hypothetical protein